MLLRYLPLDISNIDCLFSRDTDSRIKERDKWCIKNFLQSSYIIHTIRDHHEHYEQMMGGLSGMKKEILSYIGSIQKILPINKNAKYNYDQYILRELFYKPFNNILLVNSTKNIFNDKNFELIPLSLHVNNETFCGQVIDYTENNEPFYVYDYKPYD